MHSAASWLRRRSIVPCVSGVVLGLVMLQAQQAPEPVKGTGLLIGQVIDAATKQPVAGAVVSVSGGALTQTVLPSGEVIFSTSAPTAPGVPPPAPKQILTDATGRFLFRELARGRYSVRATSPGYMASSYGQSQPSGLSQTIELTRDDEKRGGLIVQMWKTATITGRLTDEAGDPVVSQQVRAVRRTMTGGRLRLASGASATTDDRGIYRFASLSPGEYLVLIQTTQTTIPAATADAYTQLMMSGASFTTSDMYRELSSSGAPSASAGGYRVGDLILQATPQFMANGAQIPPPSEKGAVMAYPAQYYPSARIPAEATVLTVASGEERQGIDLHLKLLPAVRVSGIVTGPDGAVRNLGLKLVPAGAEDYNTLPETGTEAAATVTDASGTFTFLGVTPGSYTLKALRVPRPAITAPQAMSTIEVSGPNGMIMGMSTSGGPSGAPVTLPTEPTLSGSMTVAVSDTDVSGITLALTPGVRISGTLVFNGGKGAPPPDQMLRASISINQASGSVIQILTAAKRIEPDGRFMTVGYPQGRYTLSASMPPVPGDPTRWRFRSATVGGRDVADAGLEVGSDEITSLVITFTDRSQDLNGAVSDSKGQPDSRATVFVFPADSQAWKQGQISARRTRAVRTTTLGTYSFVDLPPGSYHVAALADVAFDTWQTPNTLEAISKVATLVTLTDGMTLAKDLRTATIR